MIGAIVADRFEEVLQRWLQLQISENTFRPELINEAQLREQSRNFLGLLRVALEDGATLDINAPQWDDVREFLAELSRLRARQGFSPSETATFVFSLKQPLLAELRREVGNDVDASEAEAWALTVRIDKLGLYTIEALTEIRLALEDIFGVKGTRFPTNPAAPQPKRVLAMVLDSSLIDLNGVPRKNPHPLGLETAATPLCPFTVDQATSIMLATNAAQHDARLREYFRQQRDCDPEKGPVRDNPVPQPAGVWYKSGTFKGTGGVEA